MSDGWEVKESSSTSGGGRGLSSPGAGLPPGGDVGRASPSLTGHTAHVMGASCGAVRVSATQPSYPVVVEQQLQANASAINRSLPPSLPPCLYALAFGMA